eukprot:8243601-Lingulodinium_polyedra.AAC.1
MFRAGRALGGIASRLGPSLCFLSDAPAGDLRCAGGLEGLPDACFPTYTRVLKASRSALADAKRAAADFAKAR